MTIERRDFLKILGVSAFSLFTNGCINNSKLSVENVLNNSPENRDKKHIEEIIYEMHNYSNHNIGRITPDLRNFRNLGYREIYGTNLKMNKPGTFINSDLVGIFPDKLNEDINIIYVENYMGKKILRFYVNGELEVLTYVSPGSLSRRTSTNIYKNRGKTDKYHASSNKDRRGAVMPYAIWVTGGIWIHGSDGVVNGMPRSHGCVRVPLFYQKRIYDLVQENINNDLIIDTRNIY